PGISFSLDVNRPGFSFTARCQNIIITNSYTGLQTFGTGPNVSLCHSYSCRSQHTAADRTSNRFNGRRVECCNVDIFACCQTVLAGHVYLDRTILSSLGTDTSPGKYQSAAA